MMTPTTRTITRSRSSLGAWWLLPLGFLIVSAALEAALALGWVYWPSTMPTFSLFFSDFTHMKVWLASASLALAIFQLLWAARIYGLLTFPPGGQFYNLVHR